MAAGWSALIVIVIGFFGPRPHGSILLTAGGGVAGALVGLALLPLISLLKPRGPSPLAVVSPFPVIGATIAYNWSWLFR